LRGILWLGILLVCLVWLKFEVDPLPVVAQSSTSVRDYAPVKHNFWRRTASGWEDRRHWEPAPPAFQPALHPALVVAFEIMACVAALLALSDCQRRALRPVYVAASSGKNVAPIS
jgi:hypothetical protein